MNKLMGVTVKGQKPKQKKLRRGIKIYYIECNTVKEGIIDDVIVLPGSTRGAGIKTKKYHIYIQVDRKGYNKYVGTTVYLEKNDACLILHERLTDQISTLSEQLKFLEKEMEIVETKK